ncbi:SDR family NAD(P)-dependent oxidoreductase [Thalassotalea sp. M1531]|uniref:SDR family NAD(P)-dependent oxidoreductase n=1 Tax=Thalassotalea algicola TaxID=2716224 RepID=A0A7Y0Q6P2_9GAMM|nr:SDR family NAD(P)-dependent oxidoreductase [Thalassotalea algicola]NMP31593.1 SDR family NAD(P)-dependent oxidoreductase [Thalassotalea algicola]
MKVLITGATSGIGRALVERFIMHGHHVIACGRSEEKLKALQNDFSEGLDCLCFDITKPEEISTQLALVTTIDIAILNAGDCEYIQDVMAFDASLFERIININLVAMGHLLAQVLPKVSSHGQLGLMSSSVTYLPFPKAQAYGASKAGIDYLAKSMALELKQHNIGVSLIKPGFIKTPLTDKNDFSMPFLMSSEKAALRIYRGLLLKKNQIVFPKRFIFLMKLIAILPKSFWQWVSDLTNTKKTNKNVTDKETVK